jgi:hypothetical protein
MSSFADHFPFEQFRSYAMACIDADKDRRTWDEFNRDFTENVLAPALASFLKSHPGVRPIETTGRRFRFVEAFNHVVAGAPMADSVWEPYAAQQVAYSLRMPLLVKPSVRAGKVDEAARDIWLETAYRQMVGSMDEGRFDPYTDFYHSMTCMVTGDHAMIVFDGWQDVHLVETDRRTGRQIRLGQAPEVHKVNHFEIDFPSGELLVSDWFRTKGFTRMHDAILGKHRNDGSLESQAGRIAYTLGYAAKGIIHVSVGNSSPDIFEKDGLLVIGQPDIDEDDVPGFRNAGGVTTDLWAVTVIDRATLLELFAQSMPREQAEKEVRKVEAVAQARVTVQPGRHWVYFGGDQDEFAAAFRAEEVPEGHVEPFIVVSPRPLDLKPATAPSRCP